MCLFLSTVILESKEISSVTVLILSVVHVK
jgi:hypothetical protein